MEQSLKYFFSLFFICFFTACSTKKSTFFTRAFHNTTTHYNWYFNGEEALKKSIKKLETCRFWRSYAKMDVTIKFYAKNYPYRLIFKFVPLKIAKSRFLASSDTVHGKISIFYLKKTLKNVSKILHRFSN